MNVHTPSFGFGDEVFEDGTTGTNTSKIGTTNNNGSMSYMYQQQQTTPQQQLQSKRMINLHNTSDEYHTANEDSFTSNSLSFSGSPSVGIPGGPQQGVGTSSNTGTTTPVTTLAARKQMSPADPNEPAKPLSAYALFFRDTVSAIKQQNPTCSFQELSKIVASMWEALDPVHKSVYNKKNEVARNEYIKQMRIYRQQQPLSQSGTTDVVSGGSGAQTTAASNMASMQQQIHQSKPAVFTMNPNQTQQAAALPPGTQPQQQVGQNIQQQMPANSIANDAAAETPAATATPATNTANTTAAPTGDQAHLLNEAGSVQKCTRESCNKRAIINPDWEDEYCSNECVVIHCRNVFNAWVQSNLEAKQQQPAELQQTPATAT